MIFTAFTILQAWSFLRAEELALSKTFYFLVADDMHVEASTHETLLQGGAGYLLDLDGEECVAYQVYFSPEQAERVQSGLTSPSKVLAISTKKVYFNTKREKELASVVKDAFSCLDDYIELLNGEITRLDKGATQQSCKHILTILARQCAYAANEYERILPSFSRVLRNLQEHLNRCIEGTVYSKDLRYALCEACFGYIRLSQEYAL